MKSDQEEVVNQLMEAFESVSSVRPTDRVATDNMKLENHSFYRDGVCNAEFIAFARGFLLAASRTAQTISDFLYELRDAEAESRTIKSLTEIFSK